MDEQAQEQAAQEAVEETTQTAPEPSSRMASKRARVAAAMEAVAAQSEGQDNGTESEEVREAGPEGEEPRVQGEQEVLGRPGVQGSEREEHGGQEDEARPAQLADDGEHDEALEKSWAAVQKKDRLHRKMIADLKKDREDFRTEMEAWKKERDEDDRLKRDNPVAWLEKERVELSDITDRVLSEDGEPGQREQYRKLQEEISAMREEIAKRDQEIQQQRAQRAIDDWRKEFQEAATGDDHAWLHQWSEVSGHNLADLAVQFLGQHYAETRESLSGSEVLEEIAEYAKPLWGRIEKSAPSPEPAPEQKAEPKPAPKASVTLTNKLAQDPGRKELPRDPKARRAALVDQLEWVTGT
jgi:hypothetical protein